MRKMKQKIIFFDIDGTLFSTEVGRVTKRVKQSILKTQKQGHLCFIASGRPYAFIADDLRNIGFDGYVLANGAQLRYQDNDMKLSYLNYEDIKELCCKLHEKKIEFSIHASDAAYLRRDFVKSLDHFSKSNINFESFVYDYDEDEVLRRALKLEVWADNKQDRDYVISCCGKFVYELHPDGQSMEVYSREISKATGVQEVLKMLHLPVEQSYCFGDGPNDVEMFEMVGHPIAMGNALDMIKEKAEFVCPSVDEDGVAVKLEELFL